MLLSRRVLFYVKRLPLFAKKVGQFIVVIILVVEKVLFLIKLNLQAFNTLLPNRSV